MSKNVIFCYSGSGNCLDIAKNIAKRLGDTDMFCCWWQAAGHPIMTPLFH